MALHSLKLGDRNQVISQFYLVQFDDGTLLTVNHSVTNFFLSLRSVYLMLNKSNRVRTIDAFSSVNVYVQVFVLVFVLILVPVHLTVA